METKKRMRIGAAASAICVATLVLPLNPAVASSEDARSVTYVAPVDGDRLVPQNLERAVRAHTDLAPGEEQTLVTFEVDADDVIIGKTITLEREPRLTSEGRTALAEYSADETGIVELSWWDPSPGTIDWTIERDETVVALVNGNTYVDDRPYPSADTTYTITGVRDVTIEGNTYEEPFTTILQVPGIDASPIGQPLEAASLDAEANSDVLVANAAFTVIQELNTFIPTARAATPFNIQPCIEAYGGIWSGDGVGYYGGDNRGFAPGNDLTRVVPL